MAFLVNFVNQKNKCLFNLNYELYYIQDNSAVNWLYVITAVKKVRFSFKLKV